MANRAIQEIHLQLDQLVKALSGLDAHEQLDPMVTNLKRLVERLEPEAELLRQQEELAILNRINMSITSTLDLASILQTVVREMAQHFQVRHCGIALFNPEKSALVVIADYSLHETDPTSTGAIIPIANNPSTLQVLETGQPIVVPQAQTNPLTAPIHDLMRRHNTQCLMIVPLRVRGEIIGTLGLDRVESDRQFTPGEIRSAETIAGQVAGAIANARLFETIAEAQREAENRLRETQALQQLGQELAGTLDMDEILKIFFRACAEEIGLEYVIVALVDKAQHRIKGVAGFGVSETNIHGSKSLDSNDIMVDIIRTGKTEVITGWDERFDRAIFEAEGHADWVRVFTPITLRQENIGMIEAGFNRKIRATIQNIQVSIQPTIQEYQLRLLQAFINQVALALDNAQRYQASQRAAQREALIKDITTKVRSSTNLEDILQTTIKEISRVISSKRAYIHLVSPPGAADQAETNGKAERRAG